MELIGKVNDTERTEVERHETAKEIHEAIMHSISQLLDRDGLPESHSTVVELRDHLAIARRALKSFDTEDPLAQAA